MVLTGCDQVTGDGSMPSVMPGQRATFSFSAKCRTVTNAGVPSAAFYDGQFEFHDAAVDVDVHGDVTPDAGTTISGTSCRDVDAVIESMGIPTAMFRGTYRDQQGANKGATGTFEVTVTDNGEPGSNDMICVTLTPDDLLAPPYANCGSGTITSGNIQVH
jgi:hypothetical protein